MFFSLPLRSHKRINSSRLATFVGASCHSLVYRSPEGIPLKLLCSLKKVNIIQGWITPSVMACLPEEQTFSWWFWNKYLTSYKSRHVKKVIWTDIRLSGSKACYFDDDILSNKDNINLNYKSIHSLIALCNSTKKNYTTVSKTLLKFKFNKVLLNVNYINNNKNNTYQFKICFEFRFVLI